MRFFIILLISVFLLSQSTYALSPGPVVGCCVSYLNNENIVGTRCADFNLSADNCKAVVQQWQETFNSYYGYNFFEQPWFWVVLVILLITLVLLVFGIIFLVRYLMKGKRS